MLGHVMLDDVPPTVPHPLENKMYVGDMHASGARLGQALLACFFLYPALLNVGAAIMRTQFYMMVVCFPRDQ